MYDTQPTFKVEIFNSTFSFSNRFFEDFPININLYLK